MLIVLSRSLIPPPPANSTRTADQNVTSSISTQHSAQHRAPINSSAQATLGIINSLVAPNHGPLLSAPFTCFSCILPCASEAGGVQPPAEPSPCNISYLLAPSFPPSVPGSMLTTFSESAELMDLLPVCYLRVQCGLNPPRVNSAIAPSKSTSGVLSRWSGTTPPG